MSRNLKAASLALLALAAIGAALAGSAQAQFTSEQANTTTLTRTANNQQVFSYFGGGAGVQVTCSTVGGTGTMTGTSSTSASVNTQFSGCESNGAPVHVTNNSCSWETTTHTGQSSQTLHLCQGGGSMTITVTDGSGTSVCQIHIGSQTFATGVTTENVGSAGTTMEFETTGNLTGVIGQRTGSSLCGPISSTSGSYSGNVRIAGETGGGAHVGVTIS